MSSTCGAYHATMATIDSPSPNATYGRSRRSSRRTAPIVRNAMAKCGRVQDSRHARDAERDDRPPARGAFELERRDDDDAHREEGQAVAPRLTREIEQQRRRGRQEEEEQTGERAEPNMQPRGDDDDTRDERDCSAEPEDRLRLSEQRGRRPAQEAVELVIVRDVGAGQDRARPGAYELDDGRDLVAAVAPAAEAGEPGPSEDHAEHRIRADDDRAPHVELSALVHRPGALDHITRQRTRVLNTRSPSVAVSFFPASRDRAR